MRKISSIEDLNTVKYILTYNDVGEPVVQPLPNGTIFDSSILEGAILDGAVIANVTFASFLPVDKTTTVRLVFLSFFAFIFL